MLAKVELLIMLFEDATQCVTIYFYSKVTKILLRCEFASWQSTYDSNTSQLTELLAKLRLKTMFMHIDFKECIGTLTCIDVDGQLVKICMEIKQAILYAQCSNLPMFINRNYLIKEGVILSKKLIEDILQH